VEFSRRNGKSVSSSNELIDPEIARTHKKVSFRCQHYPGDVAVIQKIKALAGRSVVQARDVFDLGVLHAGGFANANLVSQSLSGQVLTKAKQNVISLDYEDFSGQVLEFLDDEERRHYDSPKQWETLQSTVSGLFPDGV